MTNDSMADSSVRGTITWAHPGDPHGSPGPKLAPHNVFSGNVRGPKLTQPNGMCATVLSYQRWLSPILSHLQFYSLLVTCSITTNFMVGLVQDCLCSHINFF